MLQAETIVIDLAETFLIRGKGQVFAGVGVAYAATATATLAKGLELRQLLILVKQVILHSPIIADI
jgi:hypothetical protein